MKTYTISINEFEAELVLGALIEKACSCSGEASNNYRTCWDDIKESIALQKRVKRSNNQLNHPGV